MSGIRSDAIKLSTGHGHSQRLDKGSGMPPIVRIIATVALALATSTAFAQDFASVYSSTDTRKCKKVDAAKNGEGDWSVWLCAGIGGRVVLVSEDDLRMTVSIGRDRKSAADQPAASTGILAVQPHPRHARMAHVEGRAVRDHPALVPVGLGQSQQGRAADAGRDDGGDAAQSRLPRRLCRRRREWRRRRQRARAPGCRRARARLRLQAAADGHRQARPRHRAARCR